MHPEPHQVAMRLGLDKATIGRLQACGYLSRLSLTDPEIRHRLYFAHLLTWGPLGSAQITHRLPHRSTLTLLEKESTNA
jgi:hypothetical protein